MGAKEVVTEALAGVKEKLGLDTGLAAYRGKTGSIETAHAALGRERDGLLTQGGTRADAAAHVPTLVHRHRAALLDALGHELRSALAGGLVWEPDGTVRGVAPHLPVDLLARQPAFALAALLEPERLAASLVALLPDGEPGARPLAERLGRIAEIDRERERLAREHASLVDHAATLGVVIAHLPETLTARRAAQHAHERIERQREEAAYDARRRGRS